MIKLLLWLARLPCLALVLAASTHTAHAGGQKPNVVLIVVDDMGWTDWQASAAQPFGSPVYETPNLLALADAGVSFTNAYASAPICSPTRAALMTGKTPARTRITNWIGAGNDSGANVRSPTDWTMNLPQSEVTLPEALRSAGYATGHFGKWHLGQSGNQGADPLSHGFNTNVGGTFSGNPGFAGGFFAGGDGMWAGMPGLETPGEFSADKYLSDALSEKAADFITQSQQQPAPDPFFLAMSHYLVHTPLQAPADLLNKYQNKISDLEGQGVDLKGHDNAAYAAMVEKMDESVGRLLDRLDDPNDDGDAADSIRDDTIIVFTSDHGGLDTSANSATDNAPLREGKGSLYEGGTRVPLLVSWTGAAAIGQGTVAAARSSTHDLYPTLLDLAGVAGDAGQNAAMDGVSFRAALEGQPFDRGRLFWHYPHISPQDSVSQEVNGGSFISSVVDGDWKLIYFYDNPRYELYNLASDLGEAESVLLDHPETANELSVALRDHLRAVGAQMPIDIASGGPSPPPPQLHLAIAAPTFADEFAAGRDFKADGVAGTEWDGVLNAAAASALATDPAIDKLLVTSSARFVAGSFDAPLLYKSIEGDFEAVLEIESMDSVNFNVAAIVAADPAAVDDDFLWVGQQDRIGSNNDFAQSRTIEDGVRTDEQTLAGVFRFFRLVRSGDEFTGFASHDGALWTEYASFARPDLPNELLVGITHGTFSASVGGVALDSFSIRRLLPGDYNADGVVDVADFTLWRDNLGAGDEAALRGAGDGLNGVDIGDYESWRTNFGRSLPAQSGGGAPVPTPGALALVSVAGGVLIVAVAPGSGTSRLARLPDP